MDKPINQRARFIKWRAGRRVALICLSVFALNISQAQVVIPLGDELYMIPTSNVLTPNVNVGTQPSGFDYVRANENLLTGFPLGHDLPNATNELFYNLSLDGYGGLPFGSCLRRGYLLEDSNPNKELCTSNENRDLMRIWSNRNPNLKNVLMKNMTIKNAFRTYNVVDGDVVTSSSALPHVDTFQAFYPGSATENPEWLVIQDTLIKNSDNSLMISSRTPFKGAVYQNLETACDEQFRDDSAARNIADHNEFNPTGTPGGNHPCSNSVSFASNNSAPVWLIDIDTGGSIQIINDNGPVIAIGDNSADWNINTRDDNSRIIDHPNIRYFNSIEEALLTESQPPYIELSCAGWARPPSGCESRVGYFGQ